MARGMRWLWLSVGLIVGGAALGAERIARDTTLDRKAESGIERRIFTYAEFSRDCEQRTPPSIAMRTLPAHGSVSVRPGSITVAVIREGGTDCTGHAFAGTSVFYQSVFGYRGPDQFDYDVVGQSRSHDTVVMTVR